MGNSNYEPAEPSQPKELSPEDYAKQVVFNHLKTDDAIIGINHPTFSIDEVYLVWYSYTLGNWKALLSTSLPYNLYFEVTHRKALNETYMDVYQKTEHVVI